jgi:hypothetical protein
MKERVKRKREVSRREFGLGAAAAFAAAALSPAGVLAADATSSAHTGHAGMPQDEQQPELSPELKAEVDAKIQHIFAKWGDRLNDEQKKRMKDIVSGHVRMLQAVRAVKVTNGDAPASVLKLAYPRGGKAKAAGVSARGKN